MSAFGNLPRIDLSSRDGKSTATILLHGATIVSFRKAERELLFLSSKAVFDGTKAIRGGVPICFPLFGPPPTGSLLTQHGFARSMPWRVVSRASPGHVVLELRANDATRAVWPHEFVATYSVELSDSALSVRFGVENVGASPFEFTFCWHAYVAVTDVDRARVRGVGGLEFVDNAANRVTRTQPPGDLRIEAKTDSIFIDAPAVVELHDEGRAAVRVASTNTNNVIVWNPFDADAAKMADLGAGEWRKFVCVEPAHTLPRGFRVAAGQRVESAHSISA